MEKELYEVAATVASKSRPGKEYEIRRYIKSGTLYCPCAGWKFQKVAPEFRVCRHIKEMKARERSAVRQSFEGGWRN